MKVLFLYKGYENLGVEYLVAEARAAGHEADLLFDADIFGGHLMWDLPALAKKFDLRPKIIRKIIDEKPDVMAFSCFSASYLPALSIAGEIKRIDPGIKTIFGGVHPTAQPERVIAEESVDALITGEADTSFPALLTDWETGNERDLPGVWEKRDGRVVRWEGPQPVEDLDSLPFPAKDVFYNKAPALERHYNIITSRGCPFKCTYCFQVLSRALPPGKKPVRRRSAGNSIEELERAARRGRAKMVIFRDDVFTIHRDWLEEFAEAYPRKVGLPFFCYTYPTILNEEKADLLKGCGCIYVTVGVQSVDEGQRRRMLNRRYSNDQVRRTVSLLKDRGITVSIDHIGGIPGDTGEMLKKAAEFYMELRPHRLLTYWLTYFPGTDIMDRAVGENLLTQEEKDRIESGEVECLYGDNSESRKNRDFKKMFILFALIPMLPASWSRYLLGKEFHRRFPASTLAYNLLLALNAVKTRDPFFINNIVYLMSRKKVP